MPVEIVNRQRRFRLDRGALRALACGILEDHSRGDAEVTVVAGTDAFLRRLNALYRGIDAPTDVLSFGAARAAGTRRAGGGPEAVLGDVVVSTDRAAAQARARGVPFEREMLTLVAHGVLHLLGHDHENAAGRRRMLLLQSRYVGRHVRGARQLARRKPR